MFRRISVDNRLRRVPRIGKPLKRGFEVAQSGSQNTCRTTGAVQPEMAYLFCVTTRRMLLPYLFVVPAIGLDLLRSLSSSIAETSSGSTLQQIRRRMVRMSDRGSFLRVRLRTTSSAIATDL